MQYAWSECICGLRKTLGILKYILYICQNCFALYTMQVPSGQHMQGVRVSGALGDHFVHMHVYFV